MSAIRSIVAATGVLVLTAGAVMSVALAEVDQRQKAVWDRAEQNAVTLSAVRDDYLSAITETTDLQERVSDLREVVAAREELDEAIRAARSLIESAPTGALVIPLEAAVRKAQNDVLTDPADVATVLLAIESLEDASENASTNIERWRHEQEQERSAAVQTPSHERSESKSAQDGAGGEKSDAEPSPAPQGGYDWARSFLTQIGGGGVGLRWDASACARSGFPIACSDGAGWIGVDPARFNNMSLERRQWMIVHEYAHQLHFRHWDQLHSSTTFQTLFRGNIELHANCMASARGYHAHSDSCTAQMVDAAGALWRGEVR